MDKSSRRHPELEPLEPLVLLSTSGHAPRPAPMPAVPPVVSLSGSLHARGKLSGHRISVDGAGTLSPVGAVRLQYAGSTDDPSTSVTLAGRRGKLILVGDNLPAPGATSGSIHYRLIGGTGSFVGA